MRQRGNLTTGLNRSGDSYSNPEIAGLFSAIPRTAPAPQKGTLCRTQGILDLAAKVLDAAWGGIGILTSDGNLSKQRSFGLADQLAACLASAPAMAEFIRFILERSGPVRGSQWPPSVAASATTDLPPMGSYLGFPLKRSGPLQGAMYLVRSVHQAPFGPQDEQAVQALLSWVDQEKILEESFLLTQLGLLNQVAPAVAGTLDLAKILEVTLREVKRHLPWSVCGIWLVKSDSNEKLIAVDPKEESHSIRLDSPVRVCLADCLAAEQTRGTMGLLPGSEWLLDQTCFSASVQEGQGVYLDLQRQEQPAGAMTQALAAQGATVSFAVPLRAGDQIVGVLQSICAHAAGFSREQIQLLYLVADLLGPAVSNCQLFHRLHTAYDELRITQTQLIQAEKMRALGELAGGMAHDFNNSLCGTLGFLELALANPALPSECRGFLESSRTCALDAAHTVRRVQDFTRWRHNDAATEIVDVNDLVRQTMELTRPKWEDLAHARGTVINVEMKPAAQNQVVGSPADLREVVTNLIFNAVDAMPAGGTLTIRTWNTPADVFFSVCDTGTGMNDTVRQRLFEPFFTTKGVNGTGLGLSVSYGIVQRHGGDITVESNLGAGSTFTVRLPVRAADNTCNQSIVVSATTRPSSDSLRILAIEDEEPVRVFLAAGLTRLGHRPYLAANAQEGLAALATQTFDIVLTDLGLPGMNGEEVARAISQRAPGTPVILLTGWADQIDAGIRKVAGVSRVLAKPIKLNTLAETLLEVRASAAVARAS
jgi:signal transduction histidine kinase/CheY-like chemotaxis protein